MQNLAGGIEQVGQGTANFAWDLGQTTYSVARGMEQQLEHGIKLSAKGLTGVAELGAGTVARTAGVAVGAVAAGGSLVMGAGGGRSPLHRSNSSRAQRRMSEQNIFGAEDIVSAEFTLDCIRQAKEDTRITKLEIEDVIYRHDNREADVFDAVKDMLVNDGGRSWKYIKCIDTIRIGELGGSVIHLQNYEEKRQALWNNIRDHATGKQIMFEVRLSSLKIHPQASSWLC
mgnify:CR=1 FL=1